MTSNRSHNALRPCYIDCVDHYIREVMKNGSANLNFLCNFSQFRLSNISLSTVFAADVAFFFLLAYWLGIYVEVDVDIIRLSFSEIFDVSKFSAPNIAFLAF